MIVRAKEVTPQSLNALDKHIESRGPEELREALRFLHAVLSAGTDVRIEGEREHEPDRLTDISHGPYR